MGVICKKPLGGGGSGCEWSTGFGSMLGSMLEVCKLVTDKDTYFLHSVVCLFIPCVNRLNFASNIFLMYLYYFVTKFDKIS